MSTKNYLSQISKFRIIILLSFTAILTLTLLSTYVAITTVKNSSNKLEMLVTNNNHKIQLITDMRIIARERTVSLFVMLQTKNEDVTQSEIDNIAKNGGQFATYREEYLLLANSTTEQRLLEEHDAITNQGGPLQNKIADLILFDEYDAARVLITEQLLPLQHEEFLLLNQIIDYHKQQGFEAISTNKQAYNDLIHNIWAAFIGIAITCIGIISFMLRFISTNEIQQKSSQKKLKRALMSASNANAAKSIMLSNMSHELRTPLHAILGFTDIILCRKNLDPKLKKYNLRIHEASEHLLTLINDLLDLSKIENDSLECNVKPTSLNSVLDECSSLIEPVVTKAKLNLSIDNDISYIVLADATRLKQALLNLMSNAIKYNNPQGSIKITYQTQHDNRLRINISDTGPGIDEQQLTQIFKPFQRLNAEFSEVHGTGIGLTITKQLVELMGGSIGVDSIKKQGSTFWIELALGDSLMATAT